MKTRSNIFSKAILLVLLVALTLVICIPATAAANSTTLTTTVPETLPLSVELRGNGTVIVNRKEYTQSGVIQIPRNADVALQIVPDDEYYIKTVIWGSDDITEQAKAGRITLPAISEETTVTVVFEKIAATPVTGDSFSTALAVTLMVISMFGIVIAVYQKKRIYAK